MGTLALLRARTHALKEQYGSSKAVVGAFWVIAGTGGNQMLRLVSNLLLTRLLFPEVFGIMAIVHAVIILLGQLSDLGLREGVVNSKRIEDPAFMGTAWTMQILRTAIIAGITVGAAFPVARFYDEPILAPILMMTGFAVFITGFKSITLLAYDKRIDLKTQTLVELLVLVAGLVVTLVWAWISPSVWAMVAGHIVSSVLEVTFSYLLFSGHHSKIRIEKRAFTELFTFGKWIVISSTISYITVQGDRLIMGKWLSLTELGFYSIASTWAAIVAMLSFNLATRVLHPFFRQSLDNGDFSKITVTRFRLNLAYAGICVFLALIGAWLIRFVYDDRYLEAGWMLQILALGQVARVFTGTLRPFLIACSDSFSQMVVSSASAVILIGFFALGHWLGGPHGMIVGYAFSSFLMHPIMVFFARKHGYHCMISDMGLAFVTCAIIYLGWWLTDAPVLTVLHNMIP